MSEEFTIMMIMILGLGAWVIFLLASNWRLKRKLNRLNDKLEMKFDTVLAATPAPAALPAREAEFEELRKRVQVLERIATDGNPILDREIESLRRTG